MQALVSGRAGVAILVEGERISSIDLDRALAPVARSPRDVRLLLGDVRDVETVENESLKVIRERLAAAREGDDALQLALLLLEGDLSEGARDECAGALEELLAREATRRFVEGVLLSHPLPAAADLAGALRACERERAKRAEALFEALNEGRAAVEEVWRAWEGLPPSLFDGEEARGRARVALVRAGLFRDLVRARRGRKNVDEVAAVALQRPEVRAVKGYRVVVQAWVAPLRAPAVPFKKSLVADAYEKDDAEIPSKRAHSAPVVRATEAFERTRVQQEAIRQAMRARNLGRARQMIDDLVEYNLRTGKAEHAAKSLCNLAAQAQSFGLYDLQAELTERAVRTCPNDDRSWNQRGKALLNLRALDAALDAYDRALVLGGDVVAKTGRAEVLKALGRSEDALKAYDATLREHPEDVVAKTGRAEVLKTLGRFDEALKAYDDTLREHPEDVFARIGRASILAALGKSREALRALPAGPPLIESQWVGHHIRGMIWLRTGRIDEAIHLFEEGEHGPFVRQRDYFRSALAIARLSRNQYAAAAEVLAQITLPRFQPQANLLRIHAFGSQRRFDEAAEAYRRLPPSPSPLVGELVDELHRRYVEQSPARRDESWVFRREIDICLLGS